MLLLRRIILKEIKIARGILQFYYKTLKPLEINAAILYHYYARIATGGVLSPDAPKKYRRNTMKNISRILALVLALTMVIGAFASVSAAKATWYNDAVTYLESIGVADIGTKAEAKITRAEFALMVAKIDSTWVNTQWWDENGVLADTVVFKDQADTDKAHRAAICYAYQRALIAGDGDGNFRPNATIDLAEASVVIVRLMGFQNDVPENGDQWQYNWMYVANKFCHAFDRVFMSNVDTVNPDYELSYGEAAYLLATILNWGNDSDDVLCLTKKGENLGKNFPWGGAGTSSGIVRVNGLKMDATNQVVTGGTLDYEGTKVAGLFAVGGSGSVTAAYPIAVDELEKLVRVSLGLSATRDTSGETLDTFNLGDYVQNGTLLKVKRVDDKVTAVSLFSEQTGAKSVSDTFLVDAAISESKNSINAANREYSYDGSVKKIYDRGGVFKGYAAGLYPKYANAISGSANATPQLPLAYTSATYTDADGATQYTHAISFAGKKLVYKGASDKAVEYTIVTDSRAVDENEIVVYSINNWEPLDAADVKAIIPNTAKGEARVEFYDVDGDGYYDIAVVIDSTVFGEDGRAFKVLEGTNIVAANGNADGYAVKTGNTGKVQLVVYETSTSYKDSSKTPFYQNIAVATINSGIVSAVETSGKKTINGKEYFVCTVATIGNATETKTVYVPVEGGANETKITYTIAGAKNTIKVDSTGWTSFLDKDITGTIGDIITDTDENGHITPSAFKGLVYNKAVKYILASQLDSTLTGDAADVVVYIKDTAGSSAENTGFIVNVEKTETGDNTFKVTIATSKNSILNSNPVYAAGNILDVRFSWAKISVSGNNTYTDSALNGTGGEISLNNTTVKEALTALGFNATTFMTRSTTYVEYHKSNRLVQTYAPIHSVSEILAEIADVVDAASDATVLDEKKLGNLSNSAFGKYCMLHGYTTANGYSETVTAAAANDFKALTLAQVLEEFGCNKDVFYAFVKADLAKAKNYVTILKLADALRYTSSGTSGVKTYEVRASASWAWDAENYAAYHKIFATEQNAYQFQGGIAGDKVTDADLIYVSIYKDASGQRVLKYINTTNALETGEGTTERTIAIKHNPNMTVEAKYTAAVDDKPFVPTWKQYSSIIQLSDVDTAALEAAAKDAFKTILDTKTAKEIADNPSWLVYTSKANVAVAKDPYYAKTPDETAKFARKWTKGTATAIVTITPRTTDGYKTYLPVVDKTGAQIKVLTEAEAQVWRNTPAPDGMTYEVIDKLLYRVNTVKGAYVFDADGKPEVDVDIVVVTTDMIAADPTTYPAADYPITWEAAPSVVTNDELKKVSTVKSRALDPVLDKDDYLPGYYEVKFDGVTYKAEDIATILVMKPNASTGNIDGSATTIKAFTDAKKDLFVSYEQINLVNNELVALAVIGEYTDGIDAPTVEEETNLVYLGKAGTTLELTEHGKDVIVKSTYAAVKVPSGEEFGSVYFKYSTYAEAAYATSINATLKTGFYTVNNDGEIKSIGGAKKGAILSVDAQGNLKVDLENDGKNVVDGTDFKWEFFYTDFDGNFKKAGDSTTVALVNYDLVIKAQIATLEGNIKTAQDEYKKIVDEENATGEKRTAAKIAAKENIAKAEQALADYKTSAEANNLNGKFWGTANSPAYTYVVTYKYTYQMEPERITFEYVVVDGTYCVIVNTILK